MSLITEDSLIWAYSSSFPGALLFPGPLLGQGAPVAGQVPQLALRAGRDERGPEHAAPGELGQPDCVQLVFSEQCKPSCKIGMSYQVTVAA
jgi:hypothetical protein